MKEKTFYIVNLFKDSVCSYLFKIEFDFINKTIELKVNNIFNNKFNFSKDYDTWETLRLLSDLIKTFHIYFNNNEKNKLEDIDFELRKILNTDLGLNHKIYLNSDFELLILDNDVKLYSVIYKEEKKNHQLTQPYHEGMVVCVIFFFYIISVTY